MKILPRKEDTFKIIDMAEEYMYFSILNVLLIVASFCIYFLLCKSVVIFIMIAIEIINVIYGVLNYKKFEEKKLKLDDCFIEVTDKTMECYQINNGTYEHIQFVLSDVTRIMEITTKGKSAIQIWLNEESDSFFSIDDEKQDRKVFVINFFAYDKEEFLEMYAFLNSHLQEDVEKYTNNQNWQDLSEKDILISLIIPLALYAIPLIISFVLK